MNQPARGDIVVVKVGSSSITDPDGSLSADALVSLTDQLAAVRSAGARPVLVTSGAIATGRGVAPSKNGAEDLADLQALAAIGQGILMSMYANLLSARKVQAAQVLLTAQDIGDRSSYLNTRSTIHRLLDWGVIPIINENDTTATDEITLGDNDRLSALVASLIGASVLIILTDTAGVFSGDPRLNGRATLIEDVKQIDVELEQVAGGPGDVGTGGMATKIAAAKIASWSGIRCTVADAREPDVISRAWRGEVVGTRIHARTPALPARKVWIAFARPPSGSLVVDDGAARALTTTGASLLSVGIVRLVGQFSSGEVVDIVQGQSRLLAKGIVRTSSEELARAIDGRASLERDAGNTPLRLVAVHRDDMVVTD